MPYFQDQIDRCTRGIRGILDDARGAGRTTLTADEDRSVARLMAERDRLRRERDADQAIDQQLRSVTPNPAVQRAQAATADPQPAGQTAGEVRMAGVRARQVGGARIGLEPRQYHRGNCPGGQEFLSDVVGHFLGRDFGAAERLSRHMQEERVERPGALQRSAGSGAFSGLIVPQYLTDLYAPAVAAMRPFADQCTPHVLPETGMTVNISRITTATSAAVQATENTAVSSTDIDDTLLSIPVVTIAGQATLSRQAIERGVGTEDVTMNDLMRRYASALDSGLINTATTGLAAVSASQSYVSATVDTTAIPAVWKQVIQAQNSVEAVLLGQAPVSAVVMHNRRWNWLTAAISASWPVIAGTNVPPQSWGMQLTREYGDGVRGVTASGLKIIVDANVSTACLGTALSGGTQDQIYVVATDECHIWESPDSPVYIRAEQAAAASLGVLLVVYGYSASTFARYTNGSTVINGTGLGTPSFA